MKNTRKRFFAMLLAFTMVVSMFSTPVFSTDDETEETLPDEIVDTINGENNEEAEEEASVETEEVDEEEVSDETEVVDEEEVSDETEVVDEEASDETEVVEEEVSDETEEVVASPASEDDVIVANTEPVEATIDGYDYVLDSSDNTATIMLDASDLSTTFTSSVNLPDTVDNNDNTYAVTAAVLDDTVTAIPNNAFYNNTNLVTVTCDGCSPTIGNSAFYGCTSLVTYSVVNVETPTTTIGSSTFYGCSSLSNDSAQGLFNMATTVGGTAFRGCASITNIVIPDTVTSLTTSSLFYDCTNLKSVTLPSYLTTLAYATFYGCTNLEEVLTSGTITTLSGSTFRNCSSLTSEGIATITPNVKTVANYLFYGCTTLTEVTFSDELTGVQSNMFEGCTSLEAVYAAGLNSSIITSAFKDCTSLTTIPDLSNLKTLQSSAFSGCTALAVVVDLSSLTSIPASAFYNSGIIGVTFSDSLTTIGNYAFDGTSISSLSIPDSVTSVGTNAFANNDDLTYVEIGDGYTTVNSDAFSGCENLSEVCFDNYENLVTIPDEWENSETLVVTYGMVEMDESETGSVGTMTLQEAIDATDENATEATTITITEDLYLSEGVTVSDGRNVILTSESGNKIAENSSKEVTNLITVEAGSTVTLAGNLVIDGSGVQLSVWGSGLIKNYGTLNLTESASVENAKIGHSVSAAILVSGESATFNMTGGYVQNNTINYTGSISNCAPVVVMSGAEFNLEAGYISNNSVTGNSGTVYSYSTGVALSSGATFNMSGGYITENTGASRGSAVNMIKGSTSYFNLSGGEISNNTSKYYSTTSTGAIYAEGTAEIVVSGGLITGNSTSAYNGVGGGIALYKVESFKMTGGTITNNAAASSGGGMYIFSENVDIYGGDISYNTANQGGGIYIAGAETFSSTSDSEYLGDVNIHKVIITDNHAGTGSTTSGVGGGVWLCPTGDATFTGFHGSAIYNNSADGAADDFAVVDSTTSDHSIHLSDRALGGESITWHIDGGINDATDYSPTGSVDTSIDRYTEDHEHFTHDEIEKSDISLALKSELSDPDATLSNDVATLFIRNNTASGNGGGIASNGALVIGDTPDDPFVDMTITKTWVNTTSSKKPVEVTLHILREDYVTDDGEVVDVVTDIVTLNEENDWTVTLDNVLPGIDFSVEEVTSGSYTFSYTITTDDDGNYTISAKNTYKKSSSNNNDDDDEEEEEPETTPDPEVETTPEPSPEPVTDEPTPIIEEEEAVPVFAPTADPDIPSTGDATNLQLWIGAAVAFAVGMFISRRNVNKKKPKH